jgi:hypothetical protein
MDEIVRLRAGPGVGPQNSSAIGYLEIYVCRYKKKRADEPGARPLLSCFIVNNNEDGQRLWTG